MGEMVEIATSDDQRVVCWLHVVAAVRLLAEVLVLERVGVGGVVVFPTRVELVESVGRIQRWTKEGLEENF